MLKGSVRYAVRQHHRARCVPRPSEVVTEIMPVLVAMDELERHRRRQPPCTSGSGAVADCSAEGVMSSAISCAVGIDVGAESLVVVLAVADRPRTRALSVTNDADGWQAIT